VIDEPETTNTTPADHGKAPDDAPPLELGDIAPPTVEQLNEIAQQIEAATAAQIADYAHAHGVNELLPELTVKDLVELAQITWIRNRVEPREEHRRWEAVVKAILRECAGLGVRKRVGAEVLAILTCDGDAS
jgi:hypothetical protein